VQVGNSHPLTKCWGLLQMQNGAAVTETMQPSKPKALARHSGSWL
jgi:hypothetical protein